MSNRTASASRAVNKAWERERQLVLENKGTRDWTPEQQQAIIDKGRAYDDNGRAFEGHHMKSVEAYPDYQDLPDNIQFLTKSEHLNAHGRNFQNSTNGNYDYITQKTTSFGEEELIPCEIINLSDPIIEIPLKQDSDNLSDGRIGQSKETSTNPPAEIEENNTSHVSKLEPVSKGTPRIKAKPKKHLIRRIIKYVSDNPEVPIRILKTTGQVLSAAGSVVGALSNIRSSSSKSLPSERNTCSTDVKPSKTTAIPDSRDYPTDRRSPHEHIVPEHTQRYHTKDGIITKVKAPYSRGKKGE